MKEIIPKKLEEFNRVKKEYGDKVIGHVTVSQVLGGMRGINGLFYETSKLDANEGITFHEKNIFDLTNKLKYKGSEEPITEGLIWYLFTGQIPTESETSFMIKEIERRHALPKETEKLILSLPEDMHPMTQLSIGVLSLQKDSQFAQAYRDGISKKDYWQFYYEDSLNLIAKLPTLAAMIYNKLYTKKSTPAWDPELNLGQNYARMLGFNNKDFDNLINHYLVLHSDHEGGNVSAHATSLVGSTLADPYLSYSGGLNGLAGPLHGLANQEVLRWLLDCHAVVGEYAPDEVVEKYVRDYLASGKVVPGYGHAVLREVDPRYVVQIQFGEKHLKDFNLFKLVQQCFRVIPKVLKEGGKVKNPWPNVDCSSGVLLYYFGLRQFDYYTVMFGVSRSIGTLTMLTWARVFGLPIERPGSVTLNWIKKNVK
jgi:citrate synthase